MDGTITASIARTATTPTASTMQDARKKVFFRLLV